MRLLQRLPITGMNGRWRCSSSAFSVLGLVIMLMIMALCLTKEPSIMRRHYETINGHVPFGVATSDEDDVKEVYHDHHLLLLLHRRLTKTTTPSTTSDNDTTMHDNSDSTGNIKSSNDEEKKERTKNVSGQLFGIMGTLILCAATNALMKRWEKHLGWLPDPCAYIILGLCINVGMKIWVHGSGQVSDALSNTSGENKWDVPLPLHKTFSFDDVFFLQFLLPPILFQEALGADKVALWRDSFPIALFAFVGTALATFMVGGLTYWLTPALPLAESFLFGSFISSIDPIAILGVLSKTGVDSSSTLYTLISGESLLNDGIVLVLFETIKSHLGQPETFAEPATYLKLTTNFFVVLFGSTAVTMVTGMVAVVFYWTLRGSISTHMEAASFFCWAVIPYYVAEVLGLSGVIAIIAMGAFMDLFLLAKGEEQMIAHRGDRQEGGIFEGIPTSPSASVDVIHMSIGHGQENNRSLLSANCCMHIRYITETISQSAESIVFAYLGVFLFEGHAFDFETNVVAVLNCILSRAAIVPLLSLLINTGISSAVRRTQFRNAAQTENDRDSFIGYHTQWILFLSGIRGALSYALVCAIPIYDEQTRTGTKYKETLKAMTSSCIIFTLFVFGIVVYFSMVPDDNDALSDKKEKSSGVAHREQDISFPEAKKKSYGSTSV